MRAAILKLLPRGSFAQGVIALAGGTVVSQAFAVLCMPVVTRLYLPEDLGRLGVFLSFIAMVSVGVSLRYEAAPVQAKDDAEGATLVAGSLLVALPMSLLSVGGLYYCIRASIGGFGVLPPLAVLPAFAVLYLTATYMVIKYWLVRRQEFALLAQVSVTQSVAKAVVQILLGVLGIGWLGLVIGELAGRLGGMGRAARFSLATLTTHWRGLDVNRLRSTLALYREFPLYGLPSAVLDAFAVNLPLPIIAKYYGLEAAGCYALVQRVLSVPISLIATSVSEVFHSRIAAVARSGDGSAEALFFQVAGRAFLIGLLPTILIMVVGESATVFVFGSGWAIAGTLGRLLAPAMLAQFVVISICRLGFVFDGQRKKFIYDLFSLASVSAVLILGPGMGFSLPQTVLALTICNVTTYGVLFYLFYRMVAGK